MIRIAFGIILFIIIIPHKLLIGQTDSSDIFDSKIFDLIEDVFENADELEYDNFIEQLSSDPIDINNAKINELIKIPFISIDDANTILEFRNKLNGLKSLNELNAIKGIHPDVISLIKPFLIITTTEERVTKSSIKNYFAFRSRIVNDIQDRKGFSENNYLGNKVKTYNRLKFSNENYRSGILIEKDAGEKSYTDYYSGFVEYKSDNWLKKIILGDYNFEFGQGLAIWSPYSFSKGSDATNTLIKRARGIIPHSSAEENRFLRGIAFTVELNNLNLTAFYSANKKDATTNDFGEIKNFTISGYHRTDSEIFSHDILLENSFGTSLNYLALDNLDFSFLYYQTLYDKNTNFSKDFSLIGKDFSFTSFSYNWVFNKLNSAAEISHNGKSISLIANLNFSITKNIQLVSSFRNYPKQYFNIYSNGFGEGSGTQNEIGYYTGLKFNSGFGVFNFYYDIYNFPYSGSINGFETGGNDFLFNYNNYFSKDLKINLKFKNENKDILLDQNSTNIISRSEKLNLRLDLSYRITKNIFGRSRFEYVNYSENPLSEEGYLVFQDIKHIFWGKSYVLGRLIFFQTDSYYSRIYEFENDLRGVMSNSPMFGEGFRWYLLLNLELHQNFDLTLKYSETYKPIEKTISSGNSEILGSIDNRISLQVDYIF